MSNPIRINEVQFHVAPKKHRVQGLSGWASFTLDGRLQLTSVAVRRTLDGRVTLSFPARTDRAGKQLFYFRPLDNGTRKEIERQVFQALRFEEAVPR